MKKLSALLLIVLFAGMTYAQNVTFKCNMNVQILKNKFAIATDTLYVSGSFNGWGETTKLVKGTSDSIYSVTVNNAGNIGDTIEFKFRYKKAGNFTWETVSNRKFKLVSGTGVFQAYFDNDSVYKPTYNFSVTFECNMELEILSGRFNASTDTASVNGSFNGWTAKVDRLIPRTTNTNLYYKVVTITASVGDTIEYKYWYTPNNWESIDNRKYGFKTADITNGVTLTGSFNNGSLANVINQPCTVKFTVNTNGAKSSVNGNLFTTVRTVHVAGSSTPLQWPAGGWPNEDSTKMIKLYDDGTNGDVTPNDKIFSRNITFAAYTVLSVQYKYAINWGGTDNQGGNDNEAGLAQNHTLVMKTKMTGCTTVDTFGVMKVSNLINLTDVLENLGLAPQKFELDQNYPNPFNPSTTIRFSVPQTGVVSLKLYDVLGKEVASLVNEQKDAGVYNYTLDASKLNSGVYFYTLSVNNNSATRKMLLLK